MTQYVEGVTDSVSFARAANVSRETIEALQLYEALLIKWQSSINLVSKNTLGEIWNRHFWDSAQLHPLIPDTAKSWIDLGSGAGFPGLVISILLKSRPGFSMHLVESDQRKSIFLKEVARQLDLPVIVHSRRIETFEPKEAPDIISARALASLGELLTLSHSFWGQDTLGLFLKGSGAADELTTAGKDWIFSHETIPSRSDQTGFVLKIWGLQHASD